MRPLVERHANAIQVSLVSAGTVLALFYARQLPAVVPPAGLLRAMNDAATLDDYATVLLGLALVAFGIVLSNRSMLQRVRVLRLSRGQRLAAAGCGLALASPWVTSLGAGIALAYDDPYPAFRFASLLVGFAGAAGLGVVGAWRLADLSLRSTERFPYVGVDLSRREALRGGAAAVLGTGTVAAYLALGDGPLAESRPAYLDRQPVVYERDDLRVRPVGEAARLGGSAAFAVTNTDEETVGLGCHVPWALQALDDGHWHHVTWTPGRFYSMCLTALEPGGRTSVTVPLSEAVIASDDRRIDDIARSLEPGTYRLVILGTRPYLAVNFQVLPER